MSIGEFIVKLLAAAGVVVVVLLLAAVLVGKFIAAGDWDDFD